VKVGMFEGDPPSLSLGRLAELWRVTRMCECDPTTSCLCGTITHAKAAKEDWLLEIGERVAHASHARDFGGHVEGRPRRAILDWEKQSGRG